MKPFHQENGISDSYLFNRQEKESAISKLQMTYHSPFVCRKKGSLYTKTSFRWKIFSLYIPNSATVGSVIRKLQMRYPNTFVAPQENLEKLNNHRLTATLYLLLLENKIFFLQDLQLYWHAYDTYTRK